MNIKHGPKIPGQVIPCDQECEDNNKYYPYLFAHRVAPLGASGNLILKKTNKKMHGQERKPKERRVVRLSEPNRQNGDNQDRLKSPKDYFC